MAKILCFLFHPLGQEAKKRRLRILEKKTPADTYPPGVFSY
jgi:hypothetical protein